MAFKYSSFTLHHFLDLLIPEPCVLCGASLTLKRGEMSPPLCTECRIKADNAVLSKSASLIKKCIKCGYPLTSERELCGRCREKSWNFDKADNFFLYSEIGKILISEYKFMNRKELSHYFAGLIVSYHAAECPDTAIIPVPFRPASRAKRGWDPVDLICSHLSKNTDVNVLKCLSRENGRPQKTLDYYHRILNLKNRIHLKPDSKIPLKIMLIDDVFTTGATMDYCSSILRSAGAENIRCLSLAIDL